MIVRILIVDAADELDAEVSAGVSAVEKFSPCVQIL